MIPAPAPSPAFLATRAAARQRAQRWFTDPQLRPISTEHDRRETPWSRSVALQIALAELGRCPERVLDVGCGDGELVAECSAELPECETVGIDIYSGAIRQAERKLSGRSNVRLVTADAEAIGAAAGLPLGRFDLGIVHLDLALWCDPLAGLVAVVQALRPGGLCYVIDLARPDPAERARILDGTPNHERQYLTDQLDASLRLDEANNLVQAIAERVPEIRAHAATGGLGGHPFGSPGANQLMVNSARLRELLHRPQGSSAIQAGNILHVQLRRQHTAAQ